MDTSIIAILAGSGGAVVTGLFFVVKLREARKVMAWANGEIDRLTAQAANDKVWLDERDAQIAVLKDARDVWHEEADKYRDESRIKGRALSEALAERDEARRQLSAAGKPDKQAVSDWARQMQKRSVEVQNRKRSGAVA